DGTLHPARAVLHDPFLPGGGDFPGGDCQLHRSCFRHRAGAGIVRREFQPAYLCRHGTGGDWRGNEHHQSAATPRAGDRQAHTRGLTMILTVEISMYPLQEDYITPIQAFIDKLNTWENLQVSTTATSTLVT